MAVNMATEATDVKEVQRKLDEVNEELTSTKQQLDESRTTIEKMQQRNLELVQLLDAATAKEAESKIEIETLQGQIIKSVEERAGIRIRNQHGKLKVSFTSGIMKNLKFSTKSVSLASASSSPEIPQYCARSSGGIGGKGMATRTGDRHYSAAASSKSAVDALDTQRTDSVGIHGIGSDTDVIAALGSSAPTDWTRPSHVPLPTTADTSSTDPTQKSRKRKLSQMRDAATGGASEDEKEPKKRKII